MYSTGESILNAMAHHRIRANEVATRLWREEKFLAYPNRDHRHRPLGHVSRPFATGGRDGCGRPRALRPCFCRGDVRAGVLKRVSVSLMAQLGLDGRLKCEGLAHGGTNLSLEVELFRVDVTAPTGGSAVAVYGQQRGDEDLFDAIASRSLTMCVSITSTARRHSLPGRKTAPNAGSTVISSPVVTAIMVPTAATSRLMCSKSLNTFIQSGGAASSRTCRPAGCELIYATTNGSCTHIDAVADAQPL